MQVEIILCGTVALIIWTLIFMYSFKRSSLTWASPICLTAVGFLSFYIVPSLYWQFRPWWYYQYNYFEGLPLVMISCCFFSFPFLVWMIYGASRRKPIAVCENIQHFELNKFLYMLMLSIVIFGMGWRVYLLTLGWQSRIVREAPKLFNSEELALIVYNFIYFYAACYFALVAFGNKKQRKIGIFLWAIDGFFQFFILHRYWIFIYVFRSTVFCLFLGFKVRLKQWFMLAAFGVFVMAVIGQTHILSYDKASDGRRFMTAAQVIDVVKETSAGYALGVYEGGYGSSDKNVFLRALDDAMYRLYDARSASAVMKSTPDLIPYYYGKTLLHALYALVPRYLWNDKPSLREINQITKEVMEGESGMCPAGTLAELYVNYGYVFVLVGGIAYFLGCLWFGKHLSGVANIPPAWVCMYPILAEQFLLANFNFTQRVCEVIRGLVVLALLSLLFKLSKKRKTQKPMLSAIVDG